MINRSDYYDQNAVPEDIRDRMKYELAYFVESTDQKDDLYQLDGLAFKFYYIIHDNIDKSSIYSTTGKIDEINRIGNPFRSYIEGINIENDDNKRGQFEITARIGLDINSLKDNKLDEVNDMAKKFNSESNNYLKCYVDGNYDNGNAGPSSNQFF